MILIPLPRIHYSINSTTQHPLGYEITPSCALKRKGYFVTKPPDTNITEPLLSPEAMTGLLFDSLLTAQRIFSGAGVPVAPQLSLAGYPTSPATERNEAWRMVIIVIK